MFLVFIRLLVVFGNIDFHNFYHDSFEEAKMKKKKMKFYGCHFLLPLGSSLSWFETRPLLVDIFEKKILKIK